MWQFNPYAVPLLLLVVPMALLTFVAWYRREHLLAVRIFIVLAGAAAGLLISYSLELLSADAASILFWVKAQYLFLFFLLPVSWLFFCIAYVGYEKWVTPGRVFLISLFPAVHVLLAWTNEYHSLNWRATGAVNINGLVYFSRTYGPLFWAGELYLFLLLLIATILLVRAVMRSPELIRVQLYPLLGAAFFPWLANILVATGLNPFPQLDLVPFAFAFSALLLGWSLFRHQLFDVAPLAFSEIVREMTDAVIVFDMNARVLAVNPAAAQLLGDTVSRVVGKSLDDLLPDVRDEINRYRYVVEAQTEIGFKREGYEPFYDMRISPLRDRQRVIRGRVVVLRDITRLRQAEKTIRAYTAKLQERNADLDSFSHMVAHDLKSPLATVMGYAELLEDMEKDTISPTGQQSVHGIQRATKQMHHMIDNLLLLAQTRDKVPVTIVSVNDLLEGVLDRFQKQLTETQAVVEIMPAMPKVLGHYPLVQEVFANLIGNALKYVGPATQPPRIYVCANAQEKMIRFEVRDNGVGIAPEDQTKIFEMFTRLQTSAAVRGSGLGLAIVARIVQNLGGQVGVESEVGTGSTFWFTLPAVKI